MDSVEIDKKEEKQELHHYYYIWGMVIFAIVLVIVYVRKQTKIKVDLTEHDKKTILPKVAKRLEKMAPFDKVKGVLMLLIITIVINSMNLLYTSIQMLIKYQWLQGYTITYKIYVGFVLLQNLIQLLGLIYIAYCFTKRKPQTIGKIQKTWLGMLIGIVILTIFRLILQASLKMSENFIAYSILEMKLLAKSVIYIIVWYLYFKNSIRVSIFYEEKSLTQIIEVPKRGYQSNLIKKKMMEVKIIDYFVTQKAFDYANGIYMNRLPKEFASSVVLSDLTSKKILKLKKAKYYLNQKNLENPKMETRKATKTVALMVVIYVLVILLIETF